MIGTSDEYFEGEHEMPDRHTAEDTTPSQDIRYIRPSWQPSLTLPGIV